jgi:hypothetical protein
MHRAGMPEAVAVHVLRDRVRRRETNHVATARLIGIADGRHGEALAGAGLTVDQG